VDSSTEAEEYPLLEAITSKRLVKTLRAGKDSVCFSHLKSVEINDSVTVICSYDLLSGQQIQYPTQNPVESHSYT
jgi:hypothetical protein